MCMGEGSCVEGMCIVVGRIVVGVGSEEVDI